MQITTFCMGDTDKHRRIHTTISAFIRFNNNWNINFYLIILLLKMKNVNIWDGILGNSADKTFNKKLLYKLILNRQNNV